MCERGIACTVDMLIILSFELFVSMGGRAMTKLLQHLLLNMLLLQEKGKGERKMAKRVAKRTIWKI